MCRACVVHARTVGGGREVVLEAERRVVLGADARRRGLLEVEGLVGRQVGRRAEVALPQDERAARVAKREVGALVGVERRLECERHDGAALVGAIFTSSTSPALLPTTQLLLLLLDAAAAAAAAAADTRGDGHKRRRRGERCRRRRRARRRDVRRRRGRRRRRGGRRIVHLEVELLVGAVVAVVIVGVMREARVSVLLRIGCARAARRAAEERRESRYMEEK